MNQKSDFSRCFVGTFLYASILPSVMFILYLNNIIALATLKLSIVIFLVVFVIGPLVFKFSYALQRNVIFLNFVNWPKNPNYSNPAEYGLDGARNFYLTTSDGVELGMWHILPESLANRTGSGDTGSFFDDALGDGHDVFVYNHGNSGNRVAPHRIELYKVLRRHFHVIAFDYRSYGDSSKVEPSESGLVSDSMYVYKWVLNKTTSNIFVWGHSLGTGVSTHALAILANEGIRPAGLILESPFNNMIDEISEHPMSMIFKPLPWFQYMIVEPMRNNNFTFYTDKYVQSIDCPILILHAEDDRVVPLKLGHKLYKTTVENRKSSQGSCKIVRFPGKLGYGHKYICRAPELEDIISEFQSNSIQESKDLRL